MICNIVTNVTNFGIRGVLPIHLVFVRGNDSQVSGLSIRSEPDRVILDLGLAFRLRLREETNYDYFRH